ncbi:MAG: hypothetical protein U1E05_13575, partial [Patescibacteria group bacterium]|nr:hypothetical protein [Patescibacteria group bacterium]
ATLRAETLDQRHVAADARWLVHLDLDAVREGESARHLVGAWLRAEPVRSQLVGIREAIGLDVVKDLRAATLYGHELVPDRGVLIVHAPIDESRLMAFLTQQPNFAQQTQEGRNVLTWTERRGGQNHTVFGAIHQQQRMIFSQNEADLAAALAVLDGKAASLAEQDSPLKGAAPEGAVLLIRASGLSEAKLALKSPILRLSETLALTAGEHGAAAFVEVRLTAASEEHVAEFRDVATGLIALAKLMRENDKDVLNLLNAIAIRTEDRTITARWSGQLVDVIKAVENEQLRNHATD